MISQPGNLADLHRRIAILRQHLDKLPIFTVQLDKEPCADHISELLFRCIDIKESAQALHERCVLLIAALHDDLDSANKAEGDQSGSDLGEVAQ